jgi:DNA-directed RNA polymerase specialized sigma24 family protein
MSPAALRVYRAERLLERDFHALRGRVLGIVRGRLRAGGASLDTVDLEASYAAAWQGLYGAIVRGEQVANPAAWLALVTYRRAIEELRARHDSDAEAPVQATVERDLDAELDDRARLRRLLEGMRCRLDLREREAAALCYLHGYSRAQAARRMGISETRMRKLMEGRGAGQAGVAAKVAVLARAITAGEFCAQQDSLMRAFAFGVLDPEGERHRIALAHLRDCPACRRHVAALRGLAAALPPVLTLPGAGKAALAALAAGSAHGGGAGFATATGATSAAPGAPLGAPLGASAAAGGGAAGGGWALGGGLAAKLAAGCLLALGVGAGCVTLAEHGRGTVHRAPRASSRRPAAEPVAAGSERPVRRRAAASRAAGHGFARAAATSGAEAGAAREFGPEQSRSAAPPGAARAASIRSVPHAAPPPNGPAGGGAAEREFAPG